MSGRAGNAGEVHLPDGWRMVKNRPPTYRRSDRYMVRLDNPGKWGIRAPGQQVPFATRPDRDRAIAYVDAECPMEEG